MGSIWRWRPVELYATLSHGTRVALRARAQPPISRSVRSHHVHPRTLENDSSCASATCLAMRLASLSRSQYRAVMYSESKWPCRRQHTISTALDVDKSVDTSLSVADDAEHLVAEYEERSKSDPVFVDQARVFVCGGTGGQGSKKMGLIGSDGGSVIVRASAYQHNLRGVSQTKRFKANAGDAAQPKRKALPGKDKIVEVPVGTIVSLDTGEQIADLGFHHDEVVVARGGEGGSALTNEHRSGLKGERHHIHLELKSIADVGFVGFPNAGKSSLLRALSRAKPRVAAYPFTTIRPNIGVMEFSDFSRLRLADVPGLIEGAHENKGMGHAFLKHIERTKVLLYVIDVNGFQLKPSAPYHTPNKTLGLLAQELDCYSPLLRESRPEIIAINKVDTLSESEVDAVAESIRSDKSLPSKLRKAKLVSISARGGNNLHHLAQLLHDVVVPLQHAASSSRGSDGHLSSSSQTFIHGGRMIAEQPKFENYLFAEVAA
eukprot:m.361061 g.361061  ORF g.361061 m.361061 type:complete len:490 (-) comp19305_c0_seq1:468-1937(-)